MKKVFALFVAFAACTSLFGSSTTPVTSWKLSCEGGRKSYSVQVPSTVAGSLAGAGVFGEDFMEGDNYFAQDATVFDKAWTYTSKVRTPKGKHSLLRFNSLGYSADIFFNGTRIASADTTLGVFVVREYDVTALSRRIRRNKIQVTVHRAQPGALNVGFVDWNPHPLGESMGILGNVTLSGTDGIVIDDVFVNARPELPGLDAANLDVKVSLRNVSAAPVQGELVLAYEGGECVVPVTVDAAGTAVLDLGPEDFAALHLDNPRIWWTWDLGTPELYGMEASFVAGGEVLDSRSTVFGVRSITSEVTDNHRQFYLNGRRILVKGAGWTDDLLLRDTHESNAIQAEYVKDMNMNCIRFENIWCKDDNIYDLCDSLGLLAMVGWSCQWEWKDYCGLEETNPYGCINAPGDMDLAAQYFHDQVIRLHNHPSVMCWLTGSDRIPNPELERRYMEIYSEYDYRPYVCSAKDMASELGGPSGTKMAGPYEYVGPDYWYLDLEAGGAFGFNTETGVGMNIPQLPSLEKMIPADSLWPLSSIWDKHCTASSSAMNNTGVMQEVMDAQYGEPQNLLEFVNRAHAVDYDATRAMFESFRCNIPQSTGIIQWMLNSAWPSLYWQLYDYYLLPNAAYYGTKKACEPVQLVYNYKDRKVYAVNESGADRDLVASMKIFGSGSSLVGGQCCPVCAADNQSVPVFSVPESPEGRFIALELSDANGHIVADNFYCIPARNNEYDFRHTNWYITPITEYSDMSFVSNLPQTEIDMNVTEDGGIITVTLENDSDVISYQNILRLVDADGNVVVPAFWSDNFVTVLPHQTKVLTCTLRHPSRPDSHPSRPDSHPELVSGSPTPTVQVQTWNTTISR